MSQSARPPKLSTVGERIKFARKQMGLRQEDLGTSLGMSDPGVARSTVSRWETAPTGAPRGATLARVASALNTTTDWLLNGIGDPPTKARTAPAESGTSGSASQPERTGSDLVEYVKAMAVEYEQAPEDKREAIVVAVSSAIKHMWARDPDPEHMAETMARILLEPDELDDPPPKSNARSSLHPHDQPRQHHQPQPHGKRSA